MAQDERFDVVIIGAGHNGTTVAAYLAKSGLRVCVLEEKPECGGGAEIVEPIPGVRLIPHAMFLYASPAPGFEQLELHKYGFRMQPADWGFLREYPTMSQKDLLGWGKITGAAGSPPFNRELMRATHWCPPHPPEVELTPDNVPYMQVYKERAPELWTEELLEMTMFDLMDEYCETESFKVLRALVAWWSGAAGHYEGAAVPALAACHLYDMSVAGGFGVIPRGCMHGYFHAIIRCAISHGAVFRTCCPVDEVIVQDGRATGVRLRETAARGSKTIWAKKAVIAAIDYRQAFLELVGRKHLDPGFVQKVQDISLKGGSLYVSHFFTHEPLRVRPGVQETPRSDCRDIYFAHLADVDGRKTFPSQPADEVPWFRTPSESWFDTATEPQCMRTDGYLTGPFEINSTIPEYDPEGPEKQQQIKEKYNAYMIEAFSTVFENLNSDNIIYHWAGTPYEEEHRNSGMIAGTWSGTRHCKDQLFTLRPLPELARYRTPIDGLYHCHQTSGHPGALCLMAIPYNLMHILIEDEIAEPGKWWYPSPWYIPQQGKRSAIP